MSPEFHISAPKESITEIIRETIREEFSRRAAEDDVRIDRL